MFSDGREDVFGLVEGVGGDAVEGLWLVVLCGEAEEMGWWNRERGMGAGVTGVDAAEGVVGLGVTCHLVRWTTIASLGFRVC